MSNTDGEGTQRIEKETEDFRLAFTEKIRTAKAQWIGVMDDNTALREQLKQQEEVIRELIPIAEKCLRTFQYDNLKIKDFVNGIPSDQSDAIKAIIEKAKSLTTKDK